jgi:hypothetical protein
MTTIYEVTKSSTTVSFSRRRLTMPADLRQATFSDWVLNDSDSERLTKEHEFEPPKNGRDGTVQFRFLAAHPAARGGI